MAEQMRTVEYYRLWARGGMGDHGEWDTDFIKIRANTPDNELDEAVQKAVEKIDWYNNEPPVIVGFYSGCDDEEDNGNEHKTE